MNKTEKRNPLKYLFGKMWEYSKGNRKLVVLYLVMSAISEIIDIFWVPVITAKIINIISSDGITDSNINSLMLLSAMMPVGTALSWFFHGPSRYLEECNANSAKANYRSAQLQGVMNLPLDWHNEHHTGDTVDKMEKGAMSIYDFSSETFQFIQPIVKFFGCLGVVVYLSHVSVFVVLIAIAIASFITIKIDGICGPLIRDISKKENKLSESVHDAINNISTIITLRVEKQVFASIMHKVMDIFPVFRRNAALNEFKWFLTRMCCAIMTLIVMGVFFYQNNGFGNKATLVVNFYLVGNYLDKIGDLLNRFTALYGWTIRRMYRLMNGDELSLDFKQTSFTNHLLPSNWQKLEVSNVSFSYGVGEDDQHLDNVSFDVIQGESIGLVGQSGSGKSTLLKIIRDLHHPQGGSVFVDGDLIPTGFEGISRAISLIQQEPQIFEKSIRDNITVDAEYSNELIRLYSDVACFSEVVDALPKGYNSMIKEKGVNLSGGQVQRLALTRGLVASDDKEIVLLDEPTSSLDPATAMKVFANILRQFKGKTVIASLHTLQVLPHFDRVFVFDKGKIVGMGTVSELLMTCPKFVELWNEQFNVN